MTAVEADRREPLCYVDTSALIKRYLPEPGSDAFDAFCDLPSLDRIICPLGGTEFTGVLQRRVRSGEITARQAGAVRERFLSDLSSGGWTLVQFGPDTFSKASELMIHLAAPLATLDALHLACALQHDAVALATADRQLAAAARKAKLQVHFF